MKAFDVENSRYTKEEHCIVNLEEQTMFSFLGTYTKKLGKDPSDMMILDLGCGSARVTKEIQDRGYGALGLDFSRVALEHAQKRGVRVHECDLDDGLNQEDGSFDVVWMGDILEHVFDPMGLLRESYRVLKPGGAVIISVPSDVGLVSRLKILCGISHQEVTYRRYGYYKHHTFFTLGLLRFMLTKNSFVLKKLQKILILNKKRYKATGLPSAFYNALVVYAIKK